MLNFQHVFKRIGRRNGIHLGASNSPKTGSKNYPKNDLRKTRKTLAREWILGPHPQTPNTHFVRVNDNSSSPPRLAFVIQLRSFSCSGKLGTELSLPKVESTFMFFFDFCCFCFGLGRDPSNWEGNLRGYVFSFFVFAFFCFGPGGASGAP